MNDSDIQGIKQRFGIIGGSPLLNHALQVASQVAPTEMNVLITGESGSGKESFSKIIHQLSHRKHGQFIAVNCGAIPEGTIDSELFGHEKGAFTGAVESRKGFFEATDGGTIFLDEIGEMPLGTQARLLRVLENGEFIKVGSTKVQKISVRVVAATNINLFQAVQRNKFREDLFYRLNTVPIYVPPLRERGSDILLLFRKFASDFTEKYKINSLKLTEEAGSMLTKFAFPGNIRQLKNLVEQMSILEENREISALTLSKYLPKDQQIMSPALLDGIYDNSENNFSEREILYKVLFDMRKDMTELKKLVFQLIKQGNFNSDLIGNHQDLFNNIDQKDEFVQSVHNSKALLADTASSFSHKDFIEIKDVEENKGNIHDIQHEEENNSLSIADNEKETILRALKKHKNKRKYAARDLKISERTLYRKIKLYEIEE